MGGFATVAVYPGGGSPSACRCKERRRSAGARGPWPGSPPARRGHGGESSRPRSPPLPPHSLCQRTNCASDFAVPKIAPGSGGVTSAGAAAAGLAGAVKEDAARCGVQQTAPAPHHGPAG